MSEAQDSQFKNACCDYCGVGSKAYIIIHTRLPIPQEEENEYPYPYTTTTMCKECYKENGIEAAFDHNKSIAEIAGLAVAE